MSKPGDKSTQESPAQGTSDNPRAHDKRTGRAAQDERGNSVWEWQLETGVYSRDISTQRLKKLDLDDLSIAETAEHPRPPGLTDPSEAQSNNQSRKPTPGGGFNPYDNSSTPGGKVGNDPYNSGNRGALKPDAMRGQAGAARSSPARKPVDPKKLEEWLELRKRVERLKREDDED